ncbi:hypothetical protein CP98_05031 [Sphingobium yanoikuyae]|uniref:Uncharacterized protein n=1 Tax=Sphingobium yanoikuyae TaxID=13690 RepID=A0A084E4X4_SPHYA|nr:hypothetical protein CP98_05031 [Sphingobium yanoikuyae]RSU52484.1 hypothetical protein DAH51_21220 [Sphingobium yanoikuyae]RSU69701.1 hypothetical protein BRX37_23730 [Sphingomonas sp. S-NIH.Pt3_0716]
MVKASPFVQHGGCQFGNGNNVIHGGFLTSVNCPRTTMLAVKAFHILIGPTEAVLKADLCFDCFAQGSFGYLCPITYEVVVALEIMLECPLHIVEIFDGSVAMVQAVAEAVGQTVGCCFSRGWIGFLTF